MMRMGSFILFRYYAVIAGTCFQVLITGSAAILPDRRAPSMEAWAVQSPLW